MSWRWLWAIPTNAIPTNGRQHYNSLTGSSYYGDTTFSAYQDSSGQGELFTVISGNKIVAATVCCFFFLSLRQMFSINIGKKTKTKKNNICEFTEEIKQLTIKHSLYNFLLFHFQPASFPKEALIGPLQSCDCSQHMFTEHLEVHQTLSLRLKLQLGSLECSNEPGDQVPEWKALYFQVLGVIMDKCLTTRFLVSTESKRLNYYCEQLTGPLWEKYQTSTRSRTLTPTEDLESHHRGQMKESRHRKTRISRDTNTTYMYIFNVLSKKEQTSISEIWSAVDNFQKVNVCICFYTK